MTFEERKRIATEHVANFLSEFSPPRGLDPAQLANRISHVADAFARRMPVGNDYEEKIEQALIRIRDTHESNSWPTQAAFIMAMPKGDFPRGPKPESFRADDDLIARQMAQGLAVPETQIWKSHDVSGEVVDRYRFACVDNWRAAYGGEADALLLKKYGAGVTRYLEANQ